MGMKRISGRILVLLMLCFWGASEAAAETETPDAGQYQAVLEKTQAFLHQSSLQAQLWTTSEQLLKQAAQAADESDFKAAIELAKEAALHGELAVAQAEREKNAWQKRVLN